ncbi:2OG-Fe(II) oxygenase family protein [Corynebacterium flavescens]|uniref:2OG-Fe(II) oxygenase family protein n=1 Tax=Corynebacterium flavescens TaxID=28028 RepID=UPI003FD3FF67
MDWREQIDIAKEREPVREGLTEKPWLILEGPNTWDKSTTELQSLTEEWIERCSEVSRTLLRGWAESLRADPETFVSDFENHHSTMKLAHYPASPTEQTTQGVGAHRDAGVLTLLRPQPGSKGLQVFRDDEWIDVPTVPEAFIVNIGELLEYATEGYLIATPHRVLPSTESSRLSIPFFYHPGLDSAFPRLTLDADLAAESDGVRTDLSGQEVYEVSGRNILKSRVRAYPEITEKYHPELLDTQP